MDDLAQPKRPCVVCKHPQRPMIEAMLQADTPLLHIENKTRSLGNAVKRETVKKHLDVCLSGDPFNKGPEVERRVEQIAQQVVQAAGQSGDFATLVQRKAIALMDAGLMRISTRDGLAAQQLIDRREEKAEDRRFMVNMARLLAGGGGAAPPALIDSGEIVDAEAVEVDESLYAPAHLRDDT